MGKKENKSNLVPLLLLLLSGFFVYLFLAPEPKPTATGALPVMNSHSKQYEDKVNKYLFETSQKIEMDRRKAELEAEKLSNQDLNLGTAPVGTPTPPSSLNISNDPRAEALLKDLGREAKSPSDPNSPQEQIQAELFQEQQQQDYSDQYKEEYARQFVENARKAGYDVKLNDDYKVISVKPLRKPADQYQLFQNSGGGTQ